MFDPHTECGRCQGSGYAHLVGYLYRWPCPRCEGSGERLKLWVAIWRMLRHGAPSVDEDGF